MGDKVARFPKLVELIKSGNVVVVWDAVLSNDGMENDKYLLAYPKNAATQGGPFWILRGGGLTDRMTAEEFKQISEVRATR